jgi:hypothetical protein
MREVFFFCFWLVEKILAPTEEFCSLELVKGAVVGHIIVLPLAVSGLCLGGTALIPEPEGL